MGGPGVCDEKGTRLHSAPGPRYFNSLFHVPIFQPTIRALATRSNSALAITDRLQGQGAWRAESPDIPHGWLAEEAAVFAIELAGAFVSDLKGRTGGVQTIDEHASPCRLQPKLLLILERTHGGERPEMIEIANSQRRGNDRN